MSAHSLQSAFTLVVIGIIAVLLGIILPSYHPILKYVKYFKARHIAKNLETAFNSYLDHYRTWPAAFGAAGVPQKIDETVVNILKGITSNDNKDGIAFYEFETTNSANGVLDPWSNPNDPPAFLTYYWVQVDHDYNNQITPEGGQILCRRVIVWSYGADRTNNTSDDVKSWN